MCGRFTQKTAPADLVEPLALSEAPVDLGPRYNIAPSQPVLVVPNATGPRRAMPMRWGLVPRWAADPAIGNRLANGRAETAHEKPVFRESFRHRRGLLVMDGFYEWLTAGRQKWPHWFALPDERPFAVAVLWDVWRQPGDHAEPPPLLVSACLLTTAANPVVAAVHTRMPVILPKSAWPLWLSPEPVPPEALRPLLVPWAGPLQVRKVSRRVNDARLEGPGCLDPAESEAPRLL